MKAPCLGKVAMKAVICLRMIPKVEGFSPLFAKTSLLISPFVD